MACYALCVSEIVQRLRELLVARDEVELAVVFGSAARGKLTASSDLDLGIRWRDRPLADCDALLAAIERAVGRTVDLVELDTAPPLLRFEIARSGKLIVEREAGAWTAFRVAACVDWWDFAPIARRIHRARIERLRANVDGSR